MLANGASGSTDAGEARDRGSFFRRVEEFDAAGESGRHRQGYGQLHSDCGIPTSDNHRLDDLPKKFGDRHRDDGAAARRSIVTGKTEVRDTPLPVSPQEHGQYPPP